MRESQSPKIYLSFSNALPRPIIINRLFENFYRFLYLSDEADNDDVVVLVTGRSILPVSLFSDFESLSLPELAFDLAEFAFSDFESLSDWLFWSESDPESSDPSYIKQKRVKWLIVGLKSRKLFHLKREEVQESEEYFRKYW